LEEIYFLFFFPNLLELEEIYFLFFFHNLLELEENYSNLSILLNYFSLLLCKFSCNWKKIFPLYICHIMSKNISIKLWFHHIIIDKILKIVAKFGGKIRGQKLFIKYPNLCIIINYFLLFSPNHIEIRINYFLLFSPNHIEIGINYFPLIFATLCQKNISIKLWFYHIIIDKILKNAAKFGGQKGFLEISQSLHYYKLFSIIFSQSSHYY
jgi:hypothetical protein